MIEFGEQDDKRPEKEEGEAGQEPSSPPFYDPLMAPFDELRAGPWEELSAAESSASAEPEADPVFRFEGEPGQAGEPLPWSPLPGATTQRERQLGTWQAPGYERPHEDSEGLSDLRRRLREETITVPQPQRRWGVTAREVVETLLLALLIFLAVRASFQNFRVEGASMLPSMEDGEYLIVNKLAYAEIDLGIFDWLPFYDSGENPVHHLWGSPSRGDVIVFRAPTDVERDFIKRIIGVPGDTIEILPEKDQVLVNGQVIEEPYVDKTTTCSRGCGPWTLPPANTEESVGACGSSACYFVMGDNRQNSTDSRQGWLVPEENIIGKALITYWNDGGPDLDLAPNRSITLSSEASAEE